MGTRTDLSAAWSWRSSMTTLRSSLWSLAVQWSSRSSSTSTPPSNSLYRPPNMPTFPRALIGSIRREVKLVIFGQRSILYGIRLSRVGSFDNSHILEPYESGIGDRHAEEHE